MGSQYFPRQTTKSFNTTKFNQIRYSTLGKIKIEDDQKKSKWKTIKLNQYGRRPIKIQIDKDQNTLKMEDDKKIQLEDDRKSKW